LEQRLAESVETALDLTDGLMVVELVTKGDDEAERHLMSAKFACPVSGFTIEEIEPRLFSFNNPFGACPECDGLGSKLYFDPELSVPDKSKTIRQGAIAPWSNKSQNPSPFYFQALEAVAKHYDVTVDTPWKDIPKKAQDAFLFGTGSEDIAIIYADGKRKFEVNKPFEGVINNIERRWRETDSNWMRDELSKYQSSTACTKCGGARLKDEALAVKIDSRHVSEITALSVKGAYEWFSGLPEKLTDQQNAIAEKVLREIQERLGFLVNVGLDYLSLSRSSGTLSGGESQRIRLASQIGSGLTGVLYVLDEPSIGLHQRDNDRLLETLTNLRDQGNTVLVVEHDEDAVRTADYVIDMGPGAGEHGGTVVAEGTPADIMKSEKSLTGQYLTGIRSVPIPAARRKGHKGKKITIKGASSNNLKNVSGSIPLGTLTCITGVSGSGKSTFTIETLYKAVARELNKARAIPGKHKSIEGLEHLDKIVDIDQSPIGRTPRSNPATYTGAFTPIREWFAGLPEAQARGYKPGRFSFNVKGGRCEACQGDGVIKIEMHFLPDVYVECDQCKGKRYNRETLEIKFKDKSIADVLDMTVEEGVKFFKAVPSIRHKFEMLERVGLSYIRVGQQATTLSGGEAQRVKLAKELSKRSTGKTLYILDEPTTGLHFEDVRKLMEVLDALVDQGNTVIVIEHNLEVIKTADWILDLGPEGGDGGGEIVATGTPEQVAKNDRSYTGKYLAPILSRQAAE
jgi:excinuclease ABC subunit A